MGLYRAFSWPMPASYFFRIDLIRHPPEHAKKCQPIHLNHLSRIWGTLYTPHKTHPSKELMQYANFNKRVRKGVLAMSQLPDTIPGTTIRKLSAW